MTLSSGTTLLVFDEGRAKLYRVLDGAAGIELVKELSFPARGAHAADLVTDKRGRRSGPGGRHAMDPHESPRESAKHAAINTLADELEEGAKHGEFQKLVLVGPPRALGELRCRLPKSVHALVDTEIGKDLTGLNPSKLITAVSKEMAVSKETKAQQ